MLAKLSADMLRPTASPKASAAKSKDFACNPNRVATRAAPALQ